jgi:hypothetical protein
MLLGTPKKIKNKKISQISGDLQPDILRLLEPDRKEG